MRVAISLGTAGLRTVVEEAVRAAGYLPVDDEPELVVTEASGIDDARVCRTLRARVGAGPPILVLVGDDDPALASVLLHAGADDVLPPPHDVGAVAVRLRVLEHRRPAMAADGALRESDERYRRFITELPVGVFWADAHGRLVSVNDAMVRLLGYPSVAELRQRSYTDVYADLDRVPVLAEQLRETGTVLDLEAPLRRFDGSVIWTLVSMRRLDEGAPLGIRFEGVVVEITRRRALEEVLLRGKAEWERTFDTVREIILVAADDLSVVRVNRAWSERLDEDVRSLVGCTVAELVYGGPSLPPDSPLTTLLQTGGDVELDLRERRLGGRFLFSVTPLHDGDRWQGAILVGRDVTAEREAEEVLRRQEAVDQAEAIFRTFRHEVGNALNTLKTTLSVFRSKYGDFSPEQRETYFARCLESVRIAERLLHALRTYQNLDQVRPVPVELNEFIAAKAPLLFESAEERGITCRFKPADGAMWVQADPDALLRILINLTDNAAAAVAERDEPRITISCRAVGDRAVVDVSDNGAGIRTEDLGSVFTPLFTTKPDGSGMGLAITQKLMVKMGGIAAVQSGPDLGCMVELQLPRIRSG